MPEQFHFHILVGFVFNVFFVGISSYVKKVSGLSFSVEVSVFGSNFSLS